jgi:hypothetical protein
MVLNSFEKFKENCWVFAGSFMISGGSLILFLQTPRPGGSLILIFFANTQNRQLLQK